MGQEIMKTKRMSKIIFRIIEKFQIKLIMAIMSVKITWKMC